MYFWKMSAKLLKVAYVADDVVPLNEIFDEENAIPLQKLLLFCKLWQFCLQIITFYRVFPRCVRFSENAQETFQMFLYLHEAGYIMEYHQPVSIDEYENIDNYCEEMGTRFEETYVKSIQHDIRYWCDRLEEVDFDSVVLITSKEKHMVLGSTKGRRFIEDYPNYFEDFIHYCRVKIEKQIGNIAEADVYEEMKPVSCSAGIIGPGRKTGKLLTPKKEPAPSKISDMTDATSQEIDFTTEINNSLDDAVDDGDECELHEIDQNQDRTIDTNRSANKVAKHYNKFRKGNADEANLSEDKKPQVSVPTVITLPGKKIGKLLTHKKEPSEISEITSQEIDFTKAITDSLDDEINDWDTAGSGLEEGIEIDQNQDNIIDTKKITNSFNKLGKGKKAQIKKHKVVVQPAFERAFEQRNKKQDNEAKSKCSPSTAQKTFYCDQCEKKYSSKKALIIHQRKHTGDAPYACPTCGKAFRSSSLLKSHSTIHSAELKYNCDKCDKAFAWKSGLRQHRINIHSDERRHICDICGSSFKDHSVLWKHKIRHTGERTHSCELCGKSFMFNYVLAAHMRVHTGIKNFECGICNQRFATKRNALIHQNKQHPRICVTK